MPVETTRRPRVDRRAAILDGALQVFAREGYADAGMDEIAQESGVAKPTLYNHFADKAELFGAVLEMYAARAGQRTGEAIAGLDVGCGDLRAELERVGHALVQCLRSDEGSAVLRMQLAEERRFPDLVSGVRDTSRDRTLGELAGKLAQLALAGRLRLEDPDRAARQFLTLVTDDLLLRTGLGSRVADDAHVDRAVTEGVDTFLAAFGPR